jgi:RNA polymerase sigma-70 factor (ECF subfamily)
MSSRVWSSSSNLVRRGLSAPATEAVLGELEIAGEVTEEIAGEVTEEIAGEVTEEIAGEVTEEIAEEITGAHADPAHAEDPDRDIIHLIHIGALHAAMRGLMQRHGDAVYRYCRGALHDPALVDDVHQQIFIEAHRDLAKFAGRGALRTWLFAIARHRVLDAVKAHRRARVHFEDRDAAEAPDPNPPIWERLDDARLYDALAACCSELGEHLRTAVLLRYQQGFTFEDMAEVCDAKPGTLQARVARALPKLRACIEARTGGRL